jgi:predicted flap endonuclease-1-like 5' DNA nuclease
MSTESLLELNVNEIDFSTVNAEEELRKANRKFMEIYDKLSGNDRIEWLKSYNVNTPVEEILIQILLDESAPAKLSASEESKVRREMAEEAAQGIEIDSPEKEAEWESKIQEARLKDKARAEELKQGRTGQFMKANPEEGLSLVKGLGEKSVEKLHEAGIKTIGAFEALTDEQLNEIIGPLVAGKIIESRLEAQK